LSSGGPGTEGAAGAVVAGAVQLRTALVWHGEVMADHVLTTPGSVTLGATGKATFVIPDLSLPANFAIIRPGNRGYLLTLGDRMRGTISIDGKKRDVNDFVRRGGEGGDDTGAAGSFRATPIGGRDWGVIDLDESGVHQLFFQFVPMQVPLPSRTTNWELLIPALAFSLLLHAVLVFVTYTFDEGVNPFVYPGSKRLTGAFLINRINAPPEVKDPPKAVGAQPAASEAGQKQNVNSATKGAEGKSGGKGEKPRARDENALDVPPDAPPPPPKVAFMTEKNRAVIDNIIQADIRTSLGKFTGLPGKTQKGGMGYGKGTGTGVGDDLGGTGTTRGSKGTGSGGGGNVEGDFVSQGKIDTGETRAPKGTGGTGSGVKEVAVVGTGNASGDFGGLTKEEIDKVVKSRAGLIKACYQKELDKQKGLGGKLVVKFSISPGGDVTKAAPDSGKSSLQNAAVNDCVVRQIMKLKFPAKGGGVVNYPFIFSQG
jgi:hypothetical protein